MFTAYHTSFARVSSNPQISSGKTALTPTQKLALGVAANSCTTDETDSAAVGGDEEGDRRKRSGIENGPQSVLEKGEGNGNAAVERRRVRDTERPGLVALEPGRHVGPYRLQVRFCHDPVVGFTWQRVVSYRFEIERATASSPGF